jgi:hypothetical protein
MNRLTSIYGLCGISTLLAVSVLEAAPSAEPFPPDSAFAKANPAWQRLLLSTLQPGAKITPGGQQTDKTFVEPVAGARARSG